MEKVLAGGTASEDGFTLFIVAIKRYKDASGLVEGVTGEARDAAADARAAAGELRAARDAGKFDGAPGRDGADGVVGRSGKDGAPGRDGVDGKDGAPGKDGVSCTHSWEGSVLTVTSASGSSSADLRGPAGEGGAGTVSGIVHLVDMSFNASNVSSSVAVPHGSASVGDLVIDPARNLGRIAELTQAQMATDVALIEFLAELRPPRLGLTENALVEPGVQSGSSFRVAGQNLDVGDLALSVNTGCLARISSLTVGYADYVETRLTGVFSAATRAMLEASYATKAYVDQKVAALADLSGVYF